MEGKLFGQLFGYFCRMYHNEEHYVEENRAYRRMSHGRYQYFVPTSKVATGNPLCFFGYITRRPAYRLIQRVLRILPYSIWKKSRSRKRKFWTEVAKEDLRILGSDRQFRPDVRFVE
ncbi:hypothetical protein RB195_001884 [Necator americanus]|uniref:Uncharacterized protein n=1 Tax=Necator americanus TaxID=51031 RepID=A0ABR1DH57_NECAM